MLYKIFTSLPIIVYIKKNSWIAKLAARHLQKKNMAIVVGSTIYLWNVSKENFLQNEKWVKHELAHIKQFEQYGFIRFIFLYLQQTLKKGYEKNKFETEAVEAENQGHNFKNYQFK